ncbi:LAGLIDADG family homing endonuclease [Streptomyces sp. NPDC126510]|uniref:LAGLIDADG family homing endonuclease n=1 Tax=Streptomyces sp. NPDC126510 TaxID=3155317 RepID=UPI00332EDE9B
MSTLAASVEVVTRSGLRRIGDLYDGLHELLVPKTTPYGISSHAMFRDVEVEYAGLRPVWRVTMHRGRQKRELLTTADHPWMTHVRKLRPPKANGRHNGYETVTARTTTEQLTPGAVLRDVKASPTTRTGMVPFAVAQGFVYGDGDGDKGQGERPATLTIYDQDKDKALLPFFAAHETKLITANGGKEALRIYGLPRLWKAAPDFRETRAFLLSWLAGYFAADGTVTEDGSARIGSASEDALGLVRSVAAICGIRYGPLRTSMRVGTGTQPTPLHTVTITAPDLPDWFFVIEEHRRRVAARADIREQHVRHWIVDEVQPTGQQAEVSTVHVPGVDALALSEDLMTGVLASPHPQG